jgi:hypothetical protein
LKAEQEFRAIRVQLVSKGYKALLALKVRRAFKEIKAQQEFRAVRA